MSDEEASKKLLELATAVLEFDGSRYGITSSTHGRTEQLRHRMCRLAAAVLRPPATPGGMVVVQMDSASLRRAQARQHAQQERQHARQQAQQAKEIGVDHPDDPECFEDVFGYTPGDQ